MDEPVKNRMHWELTYILLLTVLITLLAVAAYGLSQWIAVAGFAAAFLLNCWVWTQQISRTVIYWHNGLNVIGALLLAQMLNTYIFVTDSRMIGAALGIVVMDVFSFTKRGRFTLNAKLLRNSHTAARLSICLPVPGKRGLIPVLGVGDLVFYALLTMSLVSLQPQSVSSLFFAAWPILAGQVLNHAVILVLKDRAGFKGFPATVMPGLLFVVCLL